MTKRPDQLHLMHSLLKAEWERLLPHKEVNDNANFYNLGGTSLIALELLTRLQEVVSPRIRLLDLMRCATFCDQLELVMNVASLGETVKEAAEPGVSSVQAFRLDRARLETKTHGNARLEPLVFVLRLDGTINIHLLAAAVRDLLHRHDSLRTSFLDDQCNIAVKIKTLPVDWQPGIEDLRHMDNEKAWEWISDTVNNAIAAGIDLRRSPLSTAIVGITSDHEAFVTLLVDHVAADGQSLKILFNDLAELYVSKSEGRLPRLPKLMRPAQTVLSDITQGMTVDGDRRLAEWHQLLRGYPSPPSFELFPQNPPNLSQSDRGPAILLKRRLGERLLTRLDLSTRQMGISSISAFIGLTYLAAHIVSGSQDICVICPNMSRDSLEARDVVNCFVDPMIVRMTDAFAGKPCDAPIGNIFSHAVARIAKSAQIVMPFNRIIDAISSWPTAATGGRMQPWLWCNYNLSGRQSLSFGSATATLVNQKTELTDFPNVRVYWDRSETGLELSITGPRTCEYAELRNFGHVIETLLHACAENPGGAATQLKGKWRVVRCAC